MITGESPGTGSRCLALSIVSCPLLGCPAPPYISWRGGLHVESNSDLRFNLPLTSHHGLLNVLGFLQSGLRSDLPSGLRSDLPSGLPSGLRSGLTCAGLHDCVCRVTWLCLPGYMTVSAGLQCSTCSRELNLLNCSCRLIVCRVINETPNPSRVISPAGSYCGVYPRH